MSVTIYGRTFTWPYTGWLPRRRNGCDPAHWACEPSTWPWLGPEPLESWFPNIRDSPSDGKSDEGELTATHFDPGHTVSFCAASCLHVLIAGRWSLGVGRCAQWFVPDVLAGAGLDVAANTLFLAPVRLHVSSFIHLFASIDMYVCVSSS